jgi:hypothetical protein
MSRFASLLFGIALASYERIALYEPETDVVPHSKIDLDMKEINTLVGDAKFTEALFVYEKGGNGLCLQADIDAAAAADTSPADKACSLSSDSCCGKTTADAKGNSVKGSGSVRTLMGFATCGSTCESKLGAEKWYNIYKNYWKDAKYADTYVREVMTGGKLAARSNNLRAQVFKKGVAYQVTWMYVLHEYEDAIADCLSGDIFNNDATNSAGASPHAWDEGWAFYAGSLESTDGSGSGALMHTLAEKRCADFGTCVTGRTGKANANEKHLENARRGRNKILQGDCFTVTKEFDAIVDQMTVPLIQGMLKYAYKADPAIDSSCKTAGDDCDKSWAEGWAFAAAVLPRLNFCSTKANPVAKLVMDNLNVNLTAASGQPQMKDGVKKVKEAVEAAYPCLGLKCSDIGEFQTSAAVYTGMEACADPTPPPTAAAAAATTAEPSTSTDESTAAMFGFAMLLLNALNA